jgi:membrane peptidoglycan carboxypeptidase
MPIPQLNHKAKKTQSWRSGQKKYYLSRQSRKNRTGSNRRRKIKSASLPGDKKNIWPRIKKRALLFIGLFILAGLLLSLSLIAWLSRGLPDPNRLIDREIAQSTKIYDRTGETILYEIHGSEKRTLVNLEEIPDYIKWATIAIEDKDFYKHKGFSLWAIFRTSVTNILRGQKAGGSTLTQHQ